MRPLDFLSMAAVAGLLSWCAFDLFSRASDPYDIHSRQRIAPVGGITGHGETWDVPRSSSKTSPKAQGVAVNLNGIRENSALASPAFPANFAGSIATRNQEQEVISPVPAGGTEHASSPPVQIKTRERNDGHSRAKLTKAQLAAEVRAALPKLPAAEVDAAVWIIWRESGGRTTAKNPRSSSHGLNGFISRSWVSMTKRHGIKHSLAPRAQILALYHYCNDRYGSMSAARSFHRKRGWY